MHRAFDGAFPARYPAEAAVKQCREVFFELLEHADGSARQRAYTMLLMVEDGFHTFGHEAGRKLNRTLTAAGMDESAKRTVMLKLHPNRAVAKLLLQRCGISPQWIDGKRARSLSRRSREYGYAPAITRHLVEISGHDPNTYYMIGPEYRIPEPSAEERTRYVQMGPHHNGPTIHPKLRGL